MVASRQSWEAFGPLLASQAWYRGFAAATRKVFVSDGSATIEKLQRTHFSHYTSVLDILHALSYSLAAARAVSNNEESARQKYDVWAAKIWEGRVDEVIDELIAYGTKFGEPPPDARSDDPREIIRVSRVYYENHAGRMDYPSYRRDGLPADQQPDGIDREAGESPRQRQREVLVIVGRRSDVASSRRIPERRRTDACLLGPPFPPRLRHPPYRSAGEPMYN